MVEQKIMKKQNFIETLKIFHKKVLFFQTNIDMQMIKRSKELEKNKIQVNKYQKMRDYNNLNNLKKRELQSQQIA